MFKARYEQPPEITVGKNKSGALTGWYDVKIKVKKANKFCYKMKINLDEGIINIYSMYKRKDINFQVKGTKPLHASKMIVHCYNEVLNRYGTVSSKQHPTRIEITQIKSSNTLEGLDPHWGKIRSQKTFPQGSEVYYLSAALEVCRPVWRAVKQHYQHLDVADIEIIKGPISDEIALIAFNLNRIGEPIQGSSAFSRMGAFDEIIEAPHDVPEALSSNQQERRKVRFKFE